MRVLPVGFAPEYKPRNRFLTYDELEAHLGEGTAHRFYATLFFTLLRRGELFALSPWWIDWQKQTITIPRSDTKSGEEETVPLHPRAAEAMKAQMAARGSIDPRKPIFGELDLRRAWKWALAKAGIERQGPGGVLVTHHSTRHTGATMLSEGGDREALKKAGRWSSEVVDDYIHCDLERARALMLSKL